MQLHNQQQAALQQQVNGHASNGVTPTSSSSPAVMMTQQAQPEQYKQRYSTELERKYTPAIVTQL